MYATILHRKIHYKKIGGGRPILFVHGWGGNLYSLMPLAQIAKNHTIYLIDLPGFGKSDDPAAHWGVEGYGEVVKRFINQIIKTKPDYFGHSFGGEIGIYLAANFPDTISHLILCGSAYKREKKVSRLAKFWKKIPKNDGKFSLWLYPYLKNFYYRFFQKDSDLGKFPHLEANFRKIINQDLTADISKIANPTLILWGEEDKVTPLIWAYDLKKHLKNSHIHIFPGGKHNLPIAHPDLVWEKIKSYLEDYQFKRS